MSVSELISKLNEKGARKVALQFPEGLKRKAAEIADELKQNGFFVIISGDPCYGACDLALDALQYCDILVHFGHTPVDKHPNVIYEPFRVDIDLNTLILAFPLLREKRIGLVTTAQHLHQVAEMEEYLRKKGFDPVVCHGGLRAPNRGQVLGCSFEAARRTEAGEILYVGTGVFHPLGVSLATGARTLALDPFTRTVQEIDASRLQRKRFMLIERARDAKKFGIIVSSKSGQNRMEVAESLSSLCEEAVIILMNEVVPGQLLNLGFDAYVNTACPRLSYDDQERFPAPVLTPREFEILCGVKSWDDFTIDEL